MSLQTITNLLVQNSSADEGGSYGICRLARHMVLTSSVTALATATAIPALAQPVTTVQSNGNAADKSSGQLEEIVVTAQKRSENLQDVPIAVTAITASQLAKAGVNGVTDLQISIPSLNVTNTVARLTLSLRGIGTTAVNPGFENPIAVYVDGVYYANSAASILSFNNIAQIEVLKGPQGTLFGRNATGGLLQITTRDPGEELAGAADLTYSNYRTVVGNIYLSGSPTSDLAADIALHYKHQGDGWGKNVTTGDDVYQVNHDFGVRSKLVYHPSDRTKITLIGDYSNSRDSLSALTIVPGTISPFEPAPQPDLGYDFRGNYPPKTTLSSGGVSLRVNQGIGTVQVSSLTAYRRSSNHLQIDPDASPSDIIDVFQNQRDSQLSQEFQINSGSRGRLKWSAGLYYINGETRADPLQAQLNQADLRVRVSATAKLESEAAYAQSSYEILHNTTITIGGRFTHERRQETSASTEITTLSSGELINIPVDDRSKTFNKFTYRASVDHRFSSEALVYASINRGFKSGGFNIVTPGSAPFGPETLDAYEIGLKSDLLDRHLRLNVAGFYYDYRGIQVQKLLTGSATILNGAVARSYGVDADLTAVVSGDFRITASGSVISPKFHKFLGCPTGTPEGGVPVVSGSCSGNQLNLAAKASFSLAGDYTMHLKHGSFVLSPNIYYNSGFYTEADNVIHQPRYVQAGARVTWSPDDERFSLSLYGKNLTNKRVITYAGVQALGTQLEAFAEPRTYGITVGTKF